MSKKMRFKLKLRGLNELMKSPEMQADLQRRGEAIAASAESKCGGKFEATTKPIKWIAITTVRTKDRKALKANYEDNVLLKSIDAGKDS